MSDIGEQHERVVRDRAVDGLEAVAAPCLNRYTVVVRDGGKDHGNPSEFFTVLAESVEDAHRGVMSILRNVRDDWMSRIVAVHDVGERTFL